MRTLVVSNDAQFNVEHNYMLGNKTALCVVKLWRTKYRHVRGAIRVQSPRLYGNPYYAGIAPVPELPRLFPPHPLLHFLTISYWIFWGQWAPSHWPSPATWEIIIQNYSGDERSSFFLCQRLSVVVQRGYVFLISNTSPVLPSSPFAY